MARRLLPALLALLAGCVGPATPADEPVQLGMQGTLQAGATSAVDLEEVWHSLEAQGSIPLTVEVCATTCLDFKNPYALVDLPPSRRTVTALDLVLVWNASTPLSERMAFTVVFEYSSKDQTVTKELGATAGTSPLRLEVDDLRAPLISNAKLRARVAVAPTEVDPLAVRASQPYDFDIEGRWRARTIVLDDVLGLDPRPS